MTSDIKTGVIPPGSPRPRVPEIYRTPLRQLSWHRLIRGGRTGDLGRLPRYLAFGLLGSAMIWAPIIGYLKTAPLSFSSQASLILPGSGAAASLNLEGIGQSSSYANSAFTSPSVSPTETYKRLIGAERILVTAALELGIERPALNGPRILLVDQTSLIHVEMTGPSPRAAQARTEAVLRAFFSDLDTLRQDELVTREDGGKGAIEDYKRSVAATRQNIADLQASTGLLSKGQFNAQVAANDTLHNTVEILECELDQKTESLRSLQQVLGTTPQLAATVLNLNANSEFSALIREMSSHAAELAEARAHYGPRHPEVLRAGSAYQTARQGALQQASLVTGLSAEALAELDLTASEARADLLAELVRMEAEAAGVRREFETLSARLTEETTRLKILSPAAARLEDLQRDFSVSEAVFTSAIARSQSTKSDIYASYPLVQVLENPSLPDAPSSPKRKLALAAGGGATLMLLIGMMLGWVRRALIARVLARPERDAL
jgi:uncharacterized protein involved in exopolysaccharide biosynthesis